MIELLDNEWESLRAVIRAGGDGLAIGDGIATSQAIRLSLNGFVRISAPGAEPQRVTVTAAGASAFRIRRRAA